MRSKKISVVLRDAMRRVRPFVRDEGTVTVEFMLWIPLIFTIILFTVDVALIYLKQADMWNVARDISRRMSVDSTLTNANAQTQAQAQLFNSLSSATITATGGTVAGTDKVVTIQIGLCQASLFGVVGCYGSFTLTSRVTMASEY
jgi:Flp pilus assembly protein TadG